MEIDPITFEIIRHRLQTATHEQGQILKRISGSPAVAHSNDLGTGLFFPDGTHAIMGPYNVRFVGSLSLTVKAIVEDCTDNPGIEKDDAFISNDPHKGALHPNDVAFCSTIFFRDELIAWVGTMSHILDIGGMDPGSWTSRSEDMYQEGLRISPTKIIDGGTVRRDVWNLILNQSRQKELAELDFRGMMAANDYVKNVVLALCERYGAGTVKEVIQESVRTTETTVRDRLRRIPDARIRHVDYVDNLIQNKLYKYVLTLEKHGDTLSFDFTGTDSASKELGGSLIHCTYTGLIGGVCVAIAPMLAYDLTWNEGLLKPVRIVAPPGIACNAKPPAAVGLSTSGGSWIVQNIAMICLAKLLSCSADFQKESSAAWMGALSSLFPAYGVNQHGDVRATMPMEMTAGGGGAYSFRDGIDAVGEYNMPVFQITNVESLENDNPFLYLYRRYLPDSGGAGKYRGGMGIEAAIVLYEARSKWKPVALLRGVKVPNAAGLFGGLPAQPSKSKRCTNSNVFGLFKKGILPDSFEKVGGNVLEHSSLSGERIYKLPFQNGDVVLSTSGGGGGFGDPLERDINSCLEDLKNSRISNEAARDVYGIATDGSDSLTIISSRTKIRRDSIRRKRLAKKPKSSATDRRSRATGGVLVRMGEYLSVRSRDRRPYIVCRCGHEFCDLGSNWKGFAVENRSSLKRLYPSIDSQLEILSHCCPDCGTELSVEVVKKGDTGLKDIEILIDRIGEADRGQNASATNLRSTRK